MLSKHPTPNKGVLAYVLGVALGDGNLSNPNKRVVRLRITCDTKYPKLVEKIKNSIQLLFPENKVSIIHRQPNCVDVSCYSNYWEELLGWYADKGPKWAQKVDVPSWIRDSREYSIQCLRGLIETDGSIYIDRGYKMVIFTAVVRELAQSVYNIIWSLGFRPRIYEIKSRRKNYKYHQQTTYHVRLSRKVEEFLELVKPEKI